MRFQALSWEAFDDGYVPIKDPSKGEFEAFVKDNRNYTVYISGKTEDGKPVTVRTRFEPFFLINIGQQMWTDDEAEEFLAVLFTKDTGKQIWYRGPNGTMHRVSEALSRFTWTHRKDLDAGYTGLDPLKCYFLVLHFKRVAAWQKAKHQIYQDHVQCHLRERNHTGSLYEAGLPQEIRLMHLTGVQAAGWLTVPHSKESEQGIISVPNYKDLKPLPDVEKIAPFKQASYDIETYSPNDGKFFDPYDEEHFIMQIATTFTCFGSSVDVGPFYIFNVGPCDPIEEKNVILRCFDTEKDMLLAWSRLIIEEDPDVIFAYNGWKFDDRALFVRAEMNKCSDEFLRMGRAGGRRAYLQEKKMSSKAYGDNVWRRLQIFGRLMIDPIEYLKREFKLPLYNLNFVSEHFLSEKLEKNPFIVHNGSALVFVRHPKHSFKPGEYVHFSGVDTPETVYEGGAKHYVLGGFSYEIWNENLHLVDQIEEDGYYFSMPLCATESYPNGCGGSRVKAFKTKDDISFSNMWRAYREQDTSVLKDVAKYCVKDTVLPQTIMDKLCMLPNLIEMAKCTWVPLEYLFSRGQQVKVLSQISRVAWQRGWAIPTAKRSEEDLNEVGYKGGAVLEPFVGYYDKKTPVAVPDFASLYPSTMRDGNYCFTTLVKDHVRYGNVAGEHYNKVTFAEGGEPAIFATKRKGLIPMIIEELLGKRNERKKKMANAKTPLEKMIHNGAQLALKTSANSLYGFMGVPAHKSVLPCLPMARATTETGRNGTYLSRDIVEDAERFAFITECTTHLPVDYIHLVKVGQDSKKCFHQTTVDLMRMTEEKRDNLYIYGDQEWTQITGFNVREDGYVEVLLEKGSILNMHHLHGRDTAYSKDVPKEQRTADYAIALSKRCFSVVIYGDTDSIFVLFDCSHLEGKALKMRTVFSQLAAAYTAYHITLHLKSLNTFIPADQQFMNLEYEKTYEDYLLLSKKRYAGKLIEFTPEIVKDDEKGMAMKRRDFCIFVKEILGKALSSIFVDDDSVTREQRIANAVAVCREMVDDLLENRVPFNKLVISKLLKSGYRQKEKKQSSMGTKKKQKSDFGPHNIFVDDVVTYRRGAKEDQGKVIAVTKVDPLQFLMGRSKLPVELDNGVSISYAEITKREAAEITLKRIMDPATPESALVPVTHAHVRLARKMFLRDPATAPACGQRVPFVFVKTQGETLQYMKAEDPTYAKEHNMEIDVEYYLDKQVTNSLAQILNTVLPGSDAFLTKKRLEQDQTTLFSVKRRK